MCARKGVPIMLRVAPRPESSVSDTNAAELAAQRSLAIARRLRELQQQAVVLLGEAALRRARRRLRA